MHAKTNKFKTVNERWQGQWKESSKQSWGSGCAFYPQLSTDPSAVTSCIAIAIEQTMINQLNSETRSSSLDEKLDNSELIN